MDCLKTSLSETFPNRIIAATSIEHLLEKMLQLMIMIMLDMTQLVSLSNYVTENVQHWLIF